MHRQSLFLPFNPFLGLILLFSLFTFRSTILAQDVPSVRTTYTWDGHPLSTHLTIEILHVGTPEEASAPDGTGTPNLATNYTPSGWDSPLVVSSVAGTHSDGPELTAGVSSYIDLAFVNWGGDIPDGTTFKVGLYVDGLVRVIWTIDGLLQNYYVTISDVDFTFSEGAHEVSVYVDTEEVISETDETDNQISRSLIWNAGEPDISVTPLSVTIDEAAASLSEEAPAAKKSAGAGQKYLLKPHTGIDKRITDRSQAKSANGMLPVIIDLDKKINPSYFSRLLKEASKGERVRLILDELKSIARQEQNEIVDYLQVLKNQGKIGQVVPLWLTNCIGVEADPGALEELLLFPNVAAIWLDDIKSRPFGQPDESDPGNQPLSMVGNLQQINADDAWLTGLTGKGVIVGVFDTGVNYNHTDLTDHMWDGGTAYPNHGYDFIDGDTDPMDPNGHGTHVAGTVAGDGSSGTNTGVAPDATIMAVRAVPGDFTVTSQGIQFCMDQMVDVISMSAGWVYYDSDCNFNDISDNLRSSLRDIGNSVLSAGIVWIAAAGNDADCPGADAPLLMNAPADIPSPWFGSGGHSSVIAVGAVTSTNEWAAFSNFGPVEWDIAPNYDDYPPGNNLIKPNIAAPGVGITSLSYNSNTGYSSGWSGTSMATPHVSGVIALMLQKNPSLTPEEMDMIVQQSAADLGDSGTDNFFGAGLIDALNAVNSVPGEIDPHFVISNLGTSDLTITAISIIGNDWLSTSGPGSVPFTVSPGGVEVISLQVDWSQVSGTETDTITISSDDPDEPEVYVEVIANGINHAPEVINPIPDLEYTQGFATADIDLSGVFQDPDGDEIYVSHIGIINNGVVTHTYTPWILTLNEEGPGTTTVTVTVTDGELTVSDQFDVTVTQDICPLPPDWQLNPADFAYNGQVTAKVFMDDIPVESGYLAAFAGNECRGIAQASYFSPMDHSVFELICYSNSAAGEIMTFKYFCDSACEVYGPFAESVEFISDMILGSASDPVELHYPAHILFEKTFVSGWNWFSVNVLAEDMSLGSLLGCQVEGDYIKNQTLSAQYYQDYGWFGSLVDAGGIVPSSLYKIKAADPCTISLTGFPVIPAENPIDLTGGWNWIGYLPQVSIPIADALGSLNLEENDYIKNQVASATYYAGYGWFGELSVLDPGDGYMIKKGSADVLTYPEGTTVSGDAESVSHTLTGKSSTHIAQKFNPHVYEFSGTVTATVLIDGKKSGSREDLLYAFVDGELRGISQGYRFEPTDTYVYPIMIHSNKPEGEIIEFKFLDTGTARMLECSETIPFIKDMVKANAFESVRLNFNSVTGSRESGYITTGTAMDVFPNPFRDKIHINVTLANRSDVELVVLDITGRKLAVLDERTRAQGILRYTWDAASMKEGTYFLRLLTNTGSELKKIILVK